MKDAEDLHEARSRTLSIRPYALRHILVPAVLQLVASLVGCLPPASRTSDRGLPPPAPFPGAATVSITVGPPPIPVYEQPACPDNNHLWTPGFWSWGKEGYFWVPGTWVMAPVLGLLWTPGYWGWDGQGYAFHEGYWGSHVGFYGGINYGHGYGGHGFTGGRWLGRNYSYNRAVTSVNVTRITNFYYERLTPDSPLKVAYNGGDGGVSASPTPQEQATEQELHTPLSTVQAQHHQRASEDRSLRASINRGVPPVAATSSPGDPKDPSPWPPAGK